MGSIVVLMFSGGTALEKFASRRTSATLDALANRMPKTTHRRVGTNAGLAHGSVSMCYDHGQGHTPRPLFFEPQACSDCGTVPTTNRPCGTATADVSSWKPQGCFVSTD